ncbi:MAG: LemA family protein [Emcibacteraceae bacterium]|nr:LemA family protein [Emcibacteraceae bacterium]
MIPLIIIIVIALFAYMLYARVIRLRNRTLEALSSIDVQLKKRHDLVPNILKIAKKFMDHEEAVLSKVTQMRSISSSDYDKSNPEEVAQHLEANKQLQSAMMNFFAVAENYPDLKSQETMIRAQETYEEVEVIFRLHGGFITHQPRTLKMPSKFSPVVFLPTCLA